MRKPLNSLGVVLVKTINNPKTTPENREQDKEALEVLRETTKKLDDPKTTDEATEDILRVFA